MKNATEGLIKGRVIDDRDKQGMEFSSVAVYRHRDSSLVTGSITGPDGKFAIKDLPYGRFYLITNFMGYEKNYTSDIILKPGQPVVVLKDIVLKESANELEEVEVIADQARVEYKLDRKVINVGQDINAETGSAAELLENTPSVNVDIDGNVTLRGSGNFTVLIDGKPTLLSGSDALQQIPASAIRNIEIITNPSAKFDPDGMAGIINIISKKSALQGMSGIVNASIGTGEKYKGDFLLTYRNDRFAVFTGASYRDELFSGEMESLKIITDTETGLNSYDYTTGTRNRDRYSSEFKAGIDYSLNDNNIISLSGEIGKYNSGRGGLQNQRLYDDSLTYDTYLVSENYSIHAGDYYNLNLNYNHNFGNPGHELVAFVNYSYSEGDDSDSQLEYTADSDFVIDESLIPERIRTGETGTEHEVRAQADYTRPIGAEGKFEAGYQMRLDDEFEDYLFEDYDPDFDTWINNEDYTSSIDFYRMIQAVYSTYGNKTGDFQYQLGLRGELTDRRVTNGLTDETAKVNRFDVFPSLHISRVFGNNHQLMASYSRRINRPRGWYLEEFLSYMNSTTLRQGNSSLLPEYMNSFETGYQKSFGKSFFAVEGFYKNTVNKIERIQEVYDADEGIFLMTFDNISRDHSLGFEAMLNFAQLKWLNINASSSMYRYWIEGDINGVEIDTRSNNWNLRLNSTFSITSKTRLQFTTMYNGPSITAQGERASFFFANMALKQEFLDRKLSATLQVRDIFGTMKHDFTANGTGFTNHYIFTREPRVIRIALSYKINNYKQNRGSNDTESSDMGEGEMF